MPDVDNSMDVIDSRDILARIEELEDAEGDLAQAMSDEAATPDPSAGEPAAWKRAEEWFGDDEREELAALRDLAKQCEGYGDWEYGETLIRHSYFEEYAREMAEDLGDMPLNPVWPMNCIDWSEAADQLKMDYTEVDFGGVAYYMRS